MTPSRPHAPMRRLHQTEADIDDERREVMARWRDRGKDYLIGQRLTATGRFILFTLHSHQTTSKCGFSQGQTYPYS
jgi:hypothetical protein